MDPAARHAAMTRLEALVGDWTMETSLPPAAGGGGIGHASFEWTLDGHFLIERTMVPGVPESIAIIGPDPGRGGYVQHYFDARGVARTYAMEFDGGVWILRRDAPDLSPLDFHQRYAGTFSHDGTSIVGSWEMSSDGSSWDHDLELTYTRVDPGDAAR
jgi:hypothetical protein